MSTDIGNVVRIWDINNGECIESYNCFIKASDAMFCKDNTSVLVIAENTIRKYSMTERVVLIAEDGEVADTRKEEDIVVSVDCNRIYSMCYSPDYRFILSTGSDGNIYIKDTDPNQEVVREKYEIGGWIRHIAESRDGEVLGLAYLDSDKSFKLYNISENNAIREFKGHEDRILSASLSNDCKYIISSSIDNSIKLWSVETGECIMSCENLAQPSMCVKIVDNSSYFLSSYQGNIVTLHNVNSGEQIKSFNLPNGSPITSFDISPRGDTIAAVTLSGELHFISTNSGECVDTIKITTQNSVNGAKVAYSPDGKYIAFADSEGVKVWNLETNICVKTVLKIIDELPFFSTGCIAFGDGGESIYVGSIFAVYVLDFVPLSTLVEATMALYK